MPDTLPNGVNKITNIANITKTSNLKAIQPCSPANQFAMYNYNTAGIKYSVNYPCCIMKVEGRGSIYAVPDKAVIVLGVVTENMQLEIAQRENAETTAAVIEAVNRLGVSRESIQTQTYSIQPMYDYIDGRTVFRGYRVTHNLRIDLAYMSLAGRVIDTAVAAGANNVSGVDFTITDSSEYYKAALTAAIGDAAGKAGAIGAKLNVHVYPVPVQIIEKSYMQAPPVPYGTMAAVQATPIQPGQIEITAVIEAIFSYAYN